MSAKTCACWVLALAATAAVLSVFGRAQPPTAAPPVEPKHTSVTSFWKQLPEGCLGVPLGTVVRVTGEAFDGNTTKSKALEGKTLLRVVAVNGKKLTEPVVFEFGRAPASVNKPAPGDKFDYYVHEYGEFDGPVTPPEELGIDSPPVRASTGFGYYRRLTIHAANAERK